MEGSMYLKMLQRSELEYVSPSADRLREVIPGRDKVLNPIQANALASAYEQDGLFAPIGVGHGKTFISLLLPKVMDSKKAILSVPSKLVNQLVEVDIPDCAANFDFDTPVLNMAGVDPKKRIWALKRFNKGLVVMPYSMYSVRDTDDYLELLRDVDLFIADEAHYLKRKASARTARVMRYLSENNMRLCCLSGTLTRNSIFDYMHLLNRALPKRTYLPHSDYSAVNDLEATVSNEGRDFRVAMRQGGNYPRAYVRWAVLNGKAKEGAMGDLTRESLREMYAERMKSTQGLVATSSSAIGCPIEVETNSLKCMPGDLRALVDGMIGDWETPDGEMLETATDYGKCLNQLINGFYYFRYFPPDTPQNILDKHDRHTTFKGALRAFIKQNRKSKLDTPYLVMEVLREGGDPRVEGLQELHDDAYRDGDEPIKNKKEVWLSNWKLEQADDWCRESKEGIIWYKWSLMGVKLYEYLSKRYSNVLLCDADCDSSNFVRSGMILISSTSAHGVGKNLQHYNKMLFLEWGKSATEFEQAIGRQHRVGQKEDDVQVTISCSAEEEEHRFKGVIEEARYMQSMGFGKQKLLMANYREVRVSEIVRGNHLTEL